MLKYLKDAAEITTNNQNDPNHPDVGGSESSSFSQCESCGAYSKDGKVIDDTSGQGITPQNTSKESLQEFHK